MGGLLLVPPPGTPPLIDHVPRKADGTPLLTRDCPVSSMIFCDDYVARTGCFCNAGAPQKPDYCDDVSQYRCAGQFVTRPNEWQLAELAQGGCSCDATDPNEPPGFGRSCSAGADTCQTPLQCLGIDTPPSPFPSVQPFVCTAHCTTDADCPSWQATGFCSGPVQLLLQQWHLPTARLRLRRVSLGSGVHHVLRRVARWLMTAGSGVIEGERHRHRARRDPQRGAASSRQTV